jgi:cobaltochelatase CobS
MRGRIVRRGISQKGQDMSALEIQYQLQQISSIEPFALTPSRVYADSNLRDKLRALAAQFGCPPYVVNAISPEDLCALHSVASKKEASGYEVATKLVKKYSGGMSPDKPRDMTADEVWREDMIKKLRDQEPQGKPAPIDEDQIKRVVQRELRPVAKALQDSIDGYALKTDDAMRNVIPGLVDLAVKEAVKARTPTELVLVKPFEAPKQIGLVHFKTADILKALHAGLNVYLHGPAGSGKTTAAHKCADGLGVGFYFAAKVESEYLLLGFRDATGGTVRTQFREAYEHGGVFLFDEMDASSPAAIVALNAALANGFCPFPDGTIARHANFYCIGAGNTALTGATRQYVGRSQMDAASIDRFAFIEFPYDETLELELASNPAWCRHIQAIRAAVAKRGLNHLVSPRATYDGCKSLAVGFTWEEAEVMHVYKGLDASTVEQIQHDCPKPKGTEFGPLDHKALIL